MARGWLLLAVSVTVAAILTAVSASGGSGDDAGDCIVMFSESVYNTSEGKVLDVDVIIVTPGVSVFPDDVHVTITAVPGSAGTDDYVIVGPTFVNLTNSTRNMSVSINISNDRVLEPTESFTLELELVGMVMNINTSGATVNIEDRTSVVGFEMDSYSVTEGDELVVNVVRNGSLDREIKVTVMTPDAGMDYAIMNEILTFTPGETVMAMMVVNTTDMVIENMEEFVLELSSTDMSVNFTRQTTYININDSTTATASFENSSYTIDEGEEVMITVVLSPSDISLDRPVTLTLTLTAMDGSATASSDFTPPPQTINIIIGNTSDTFIIEALNDRIVEDEEMFELSLTADSDQAVTVQSGVATVSIEDTTSIMIMFDMTSYEIKEGESLGANVSIVNTTLDREVTTELNVPDGLNINPDMLEFDNTTNTVSITIMAIRDNVVNENERRTYELTINNTGPMNMFQLVNPVTVTVIDTTIKLMIEPDKPEVFEGGSISLNLSTSSPLVNFSVTPVAMPDDQVSFMPSSILFSASNMVFSVVVMATSDADVMNKTITIEFRADGQSLNFQPETIDLAIVDRTVISVRSPVSEGVVVGDTVSLTCQFISAYEITIIWSRDDGTTVNDSLVTSSQDNITYNSTLTINSIDFEHCANYTCNVDNVASSYPAEIGVYINTGTSDTDQFSSIGAEDILFCSIEYCGSFEIGWYIENDTVSNITINNITPYNATDIIRLNSTAMIGSVGGINQGRKQLCRVIYRGDIIYYTTFNYTLQGIDVNITVTPDNRTTGSSRHDTFEFIFNNTVVLNCTATNPPNVDLPIDIWWIKATDRSIEFASPYFNNISTGNDIMVLSGSGYVALVFDKIQDNDNHEGEYTCRANSRMGSNEDEEQKTIIIDVISGPVVQFPYPEIVAERGKSRNIICNTTGSNPPATFIVIRTVGPDGVVDLVNGTNVTIVTYTIDNPMFDQTGTVYECFAVNDIGNETSPNSTLRVIDAPEPVIGNTIISTSVSLLVSYIVWDAPVDNNDPIKKYDIRLCRLDFDNDCESYSTSGESLRVPLVPNITYSFTITSENEGGKSSATTVNITGATDGAMPIFLLQRFYTTDTIQFNWTVSNLVTNISGFDIIIQNYTITREGEDVGSTENNVFIDQIKDEDSGTTVLYQIRAFYKNGKINTNLPVTTTFNATLPERAPVIPAVNQNPKKLDQVENPNGSTFGFIVEWNPPEDINPSLITIYSVTVTRGGALSTGRRRRRRRREALPSRSGETTTTNTTATTLTFNSINDGDAFTDFTVNSVALVQVGNGGTAEIIALGDTVIRTSPGNPTVPRDPQILTRDILFVVIGWNEPVDPRGEKIESYTVVVRDVAGSATGTIPSNIDTTSARVSGLKPNTSYTAFISAFNGKFVGSSTQLIFTTSFGVERPVFLTDIRAITEQEQQLYSFSVTIQDTLGPISHFVVYAVITDIAPTSVTEDDRTYITAATTVGNIIGRRDYPVAIGNGVEQELSLTNGGTIKYENRPVRRGVTYYYIVRAYSSLDPTIFNDSVPMKPVQIIPAPDEQTNTTIIAIAVILGVLAVILIIVLIVLVLFAFRGRLFSASYKVQSHLRRYDDGDKGGLELRRRTRHFTPVLDVGDPNAFTSAGQPTTLVCEVSGTPAPTVKWSRGEKPVEDDERFLILADHSLFIQNTSIEDEGSYLVTAENSTGKTAAEIKVTVIKPSPPEPDEAHKPIQVDQFPEYYARITANDGDDLDEEYQDVEPDCPNTAYAAKLSINRNKNRYINIIPYDHSRVVLALQENTPGSDYINASFINGFKRSDQYIATQGPTTTTLADFWRMVWEFDCPTIVMVTKLEEEDKKKCERYWPSYGSTTYGNIQVTLKEAENLAEYSIRTFTISPLAGQSSAQMPVREVKQFHFLKWPDHGVPNYATALLHFRKRVHLYHPMQRGPMIVHCSAGVGRTGTFITVDYNMERMEGEGTVDIFNFVQQMRFKRNYMVQTSSQYEFIHEAINEAITCGDTSIKAPELKEWLSKLTSDPETGETILQEQFKRLDTASPHDDEFDCTVAESNPDKNRMKKHLPANEQRVVLPSEGDLSDYICASYVDGYRQRNAFMITQGPMENTTGDFWRMVWEMKSAAIVMLTQLEEDGEEMSKKYWSDTVGEGAPFGQFNVELTSEVRDLGDYCTRKIKLSPISKPQESRIVTQFHFTKWSRKTSPESAKPMIDMIDELQRVQRKSGNQPITVHCNDGLGRTGTFCALYYVLDRVKTEQVVDVFQAVKTLRIQRTGLVDNVEQYKFIHTATVEFLNTFSDYQNFK